MRFSAAINRIPVNFAANTGFTPWTIPDSLLIVDGIFRVGGINPRQEVWKK
jgi:hypothetical protein